MKKLVIFDLDGTLLNTINDLGTSCNYALTQLGYNEIPLSTYPFLVGNGVRRLIERALPDVNDDITSKLLEIFKSHYDLHNTDLTTPYNGICELLDELKAMNVNIAVASNKYESAAIKIVSHFFPDIPFVAVLGQVDGRNIKPDPSIIFSILNACPTPKSEVLYVGDSAVDIETARRACVESVGVTWGFRPVSELRQAYADHIVSSPSEIMTFVNS